MSLDLDLSDRSSLRDPGLAHAVDNGRAAREVDRIVAPGGCAEIRDGELAVKRHSYSNL